MYALKSGKYKSEEELEPVVASLLAF